MVIARIRFSVADVAVLFGQKYGLRMMRSARLLSLAFLPSLIDTFGFLTIRPSAMDRSAYIVRHTIVIVSTVVGFLLPVSTEVELGGNAIRTIHPAHKINADMEYIMRCRDENLARWKSLILGMFLGHHYLERDSLRR